MNIANGDSDTHGAVIPNVLTLNGVDVCGTSSDAVVADLT